MEALLVDKIPAGRCRASAARLTASCFLLGVWEFSVRIWYIV